MKELSAAISILDEVAFRLLLVKESFRLTKKIIYPQVSDILLQLPITWLLNLILL